MVERVFPHPASPPEEDLAAKASAGVKIAPFHRKAQRGISLIEVLVALGILGIISPVFFLSLQTGSRATQVLDEQVQAEALARSQLESVKSSSYLSCNPTPCYSVITGIPGQYVVSVAVQILDTPTCATDGNCNTLQLVTATVSRPIGGGGNRQVLSASVYKVKK